MTFTQLALALYKAGEDGKLRTVKVLKDITGLTLRPSKEVIDNFCTCTDNNKLGIDFKGIMKNLHAKEDWKEIRSSIRKANYYMILVNNLLIP